MVNLAYLKWHMFVQTNKNDDDYKCRCYERSELNLKKKTFKIILNNMYALQYMAWKWNYG